MDSLSAGRNDPRQKWLPAYRSRSTLILVRRINPGELNFVYFHQLTYL